MLAIKSVIKSFYKINVKIEKQDQLKGQLLSQYEENSVLLSVFFFPCRESRIVVECTCTEIKYLWLRTTIKAPFTENRLFATNMIQKRQELKRLLTQRDRERVGARKRDMSIPWDILQPARMPSSLHLQINS